MFIYMQYVCAIVKSTKGIQGATLNKNTGIIIKVLLSFFMQHDTVNQQIWRAIVLFKMFSRWFFANKKLIIAFRTWKFGDVT